jgi:uncharacterized OB-fold protein
METRTAEIAMPCAGCGKESEPGESLCAACLARLPDLNWKEEE